MDNKELFEAMMQLSLNPECERTKYDKCLPEDYVPAFIMEVDWHCNYAHMFEKYCANYERFKMGWLLPFYNELDGENRLAFREWLEEFVDVRHLMLTLRKHKKVQVFADERKMFVDRCKRFDVAIHAGEFDPDGPTRVYYIE